MSDGGRESRRDGDTECQWPREPEGDDSFNQAVSKIAVAQICDGLGFQSLRESALESLAEIAIRYVRDLGRTSNFYANLAGRTQCNVFDIILGLEDLGFSEGFLGASSGVVRKISEYVGLAEEIPFDQPIPQFPVIKNQRAIPSFIRMGETPSKHVPAWLPALPDSHTYTHTPVWNERVVDPRAEKIEQARQRRSAERSLVSLQQRLLYASPVASLASMEHGDAAKALRVDKSNPFLAAAGMAAVEMGDEARPSSPAEGNPFLAIPLQPGEKDVSPVVLPTKLKDEAVVGNHASVLEAFAPAIQAGKGGSSGNGERKFLRDKRPTVHFKFRTAKKILGECKSLSLKDNAC